MPLKDKEAKRQYQKEYHKQWYRKNKEKQQAAQKERRSQVREWFRDYKSGLSCCKCGEDHPATIDFHHRNSADKDSLVSKMVSEGYSQDRIMNEVSKCDVLCANCHRKIHYKGH